MENLKHAFGIHFHETSIGAAPKCILNQVARRTRERYQPALPVVLFVNPGFVTGPGGNWMLFRWWATRRRSLRNVLLLFGTVSSVIALFVNFLPEIEKMPWWGIALLVLAAFLAGTLGILEMFERPKRRIFRKQDTAGVLKYMHEWIKHGGRVAIWSRDMSWANNEETKQLLELKAQRHELLLFLPSANPLSGQLESSGAEVVYYGASRLESPGSRFTITHYGRDGSSIAVGRARGDSHVIDEFHSSDHPAYQIAADLIALARSTSIR